MKYKDLVNTWRAVMLDKIRSYPHKLLTDIQTLAYSALTSPRLT